MNDAQALKDVKEAIAAQEKLRGTLPDEQLEAILKPLKEKEAELEARLAGAGGPGIQVIGGGAVATGGSTAVGERGVHVGGSVTGSIITGDSSQVRQMIGAMPQASNADKQTLEALIQQLKEAVAQVEPAQQAQAQTVAQATEELVKEAAAPEPNKTRIQITGEGLKKAAENIAAVMPIVGRIVAAIFRMTGVPLG